MTVTGKSKAKKPKVKPGLTKPETRDAATSGNDLGGRPTEWDDRFVQIASALGRLGATDLEIAMAFDVSTRTIYRWKLEHPDFAEALKLSKEAADKRVEDSLFKRAVGYTFDEEVVTIAKDGTMFRTDVLKHIPPDTTAAIFWLKNRNKADWADTKNMKHDLEENSPISTFLKQISGKSIIPGEEAPGIKEHAPGLGKQGFVAIGVQGDD
jgi:hypothetical protein